MLAICTITMAEGEIKFLPRLPFPTISRFPPKIRRRLAKYLPVAMRPLSAEDVGDVSILLVFP
jgi:hypothetical protein